jgi:hypothetical protein
MLSPNVACSCYPPCVCECPTRLQVCEGLEWLLARVHTVRRLRRNARNGALALAGFQAANAE